MSLQILLNEPHLILAYDYVQAWIFADWRGNQNLTTVQQGCQNILRVLREQRCYKVLNDNTLVTSMWSEAAEWGGTEWFPAMSEAGLQYFAWVYSPNVYSRLSTDLTLQYNAGNATVATFDDLNTAKAWLQQK
jgi:hypothetical protein